MVRARWAAAVLVGCGGGPDKGGDDLPSDTSGNVVGCAAGDVALEVGTGDEGYVPVANGDTVTMVHGPQGGWHITVGGLLTNSEEEVSVLPMIRADALGLDVTGAQSPNYLALADYDDGACTGVFYDLRAFVSTDRATGPSGQQFVCDLEGQTVTLSVVAEDIVSLRQATGEVEVVLALDPIDVPECP